jgi:hypothetical protein
MDDFAPVTVHLETPAAITLLSWIVADCDGIGYVTTEDPSQGVVSIYCLPGNIARIEILLSSLREEGFPVVSWNRENEIRKGKAS